MKIRQNNPKLIKIQNNGQIKPNRWKCTKDRQLSTKHPSRWAQKGSRIEENNESSKSPTFTLLYSWTNLKSKAKQSQTRTT